MKDHFTKHEVILEDRNGDGANACLKGDPWPHCIPVEVDLDAWRATGAAGEDCEGEVYFAAAGTPVGMNP